MAACGAGRTEDEERVRREGIFRYADRADRAVGRYREPEAADCPVGMSCRGLLQPTYSVAASSNQSVR
jgi:hypothetical protein